MNKSVSRFDVVFPFNFGLPATLPANRAIAAAALAASRAHGIPIFSAPAGIIDYGDYPAVVVSDFSGYVSTIKQVRALVATARTRQWTRVLVIAAPPHRWRALRDVRAHGFVAETDETLRAAPRQLWYSKQSEHRQTTSWLRWWFAWEIPARVVLVLHRRSYEQITGR